jgi:peroxiredoxin
MVNMRRPTLFAILLALAASALAVSPAPRKSPEFTIVEPSGREMLLSSFKGKVVLIEFLWTNCPHCQRASRTISRLHQELGSRGFQPIGIALEPGVTPSMVTGFIRQFGVTYLMGYSTPEAVDGYLGRSVMERLMVPQIIVIDREGVIRAQSGAKGDPNLEDETYLRNLIGGLLQQSAPVGSTR